MIGFGLFDLYISISSAFKSCLKFVNISLCYGFFAMDLQFNCNITWPHPCSFSLRLIQKPQTVFILCFTFYWKPFVHSPCCSLATMVRLQPWPLEKEADLFCCALPLLIMSLCGILNSAKVECRMVRESKELSSGVWSVLLNITVFFFTLDCKKLFTDHFAGWIWHFSFLKIEQSIQWNITSFTHGWLLYVCVYVYL